MESLLITYGWSLESFSNGFYFVSDCCGTPQTWKSLFFSPVDMLADASFRVGKGRNGTKQLTPPYDIASHNLWLVPGIILQRCLSRFGQLWHPSVTEESVFSVQSTCSSLHHFVLETYESGPNK